MGPGATRLTHVDGVSDDLLTAGCAWRFLL